MCPTHSVDDSSSTISMDNHKNDAFESGRDLSLSLADDSYNLPPFKSSTSRQEAHAKFILNSEDDLFDSPPARVPQSANPNDSIDVSFHCDPNESNTDGDGLSFTTNMSLEASLEEERQRVRQKNRARDKVEEIKEKIETSKDKIEPSVDPKNSLNSFSMQATPLFAFREPVLSQVDDDEKDDTVLSRATSANSVSMVNDDEEMPTFTPVDLDLGSLEVMNDPSLFAVAQAQCKVRSGLQQSHPSRPHSPPSHRALSDIDPETPQLALQYSFTQAPEDTSMEEEEERKQKEDREEKEEREEGEEDKRGKKGRPLNDDEELVDNRKSRRIAEVQKEEGREAENTRKSVVDNKRTKKEEERDKQRATEDNEKLVDSRKAKRMAAASEKEKTKQQVPEASGGSKEKSKANEIETNEKERQQEELETQRTKKKEEAEQKKDSNTPTKDKLTIRKEMQMEREMERERIKREAEMARQRKEREEEMAKERETEEKKRHDKKEKKKLLQKHQKRTFAQATAKEKQRDQEESNSTEKQHEEEMNRDARIEKGDKEDEEDKAHVKSKDHRKASDKQDKKDQEEKRRRDDKNGKRQKELNDKKEEQEVPGRKTIQKLPRDSPIPPPKSTRLDVVQGSSFVDHVEGSLGDTTFNHKDDEEEETNESKSKSKSNEKGKQKATESKEEEKDAKKSNKEEEQKRKSKKEEKGKERMSEPSLQAQTPFSELPTITRNYKSKRSDAPANTKGKKEARELEEVKTKETKGTKDDKSAREAVDKKGKRPAVKESAEEEDGEDSEREADTVVNKKRTLPFSLSDAKPTRKARPEKESTKPDKEFDTPEDKLGWTKKKSAKSEERSPARKRKENKRDRYNERRKKKERDEEEIDEVAEEWDSSEEEDGPTRGRRSLRVTNKRKRFVVESTQDENDWITDEIIGNEEEDGEEEEQTTKGKKKTKVDKANKTDKKKEAEDDGAPGPSSKPNTYCPFPLLTPSLLLPSSPSSSLLSPLDNSNFYISYSPGLLKLMMELYSAAKSKKTTKNIFRGISFAFTGITKNESRPESEQKLKAMVKSHGGTLLDTHQFQANPNPNRSPVSKKKMPKTVLISDQSHQTLKYIMAVAGGTPCVHLEWITECCAKEALVSLESHLLPAGTLLDNDDDDPVFIKSASSDIFHGLRVEVIGASDFKEGWSKVLRSTGAKVVQRMFTEYEDRVECVLSDPLPDKILLKRADKLCIPVVSATWLIQSILRQKPVPYDANPLYYTFHVEDA